MQDGLERLLHAVADLRRRHAQHGGIRQVPPGPHAKVDAPPGEVVEQHDAVGHHQRVVVGQAHRSGSEANMPGALGGHCEKDLGR